MKHLILLTRRNQKNRFYEEHKSDFIMPNAGVRGASRRYFSMMLVSEFNKLQRMKKLITGCLGIWLGLSWVNGVAVQYIELKSGMCIPQEKDGVHYKNAPCFSAEWGMAWESWRLGLQCGYVKYENKDAPTGNVHHGTVFGLDSCKNKKFTAFSLMANLYYDWHFREETAFYVGCGLGVTRLNYRFCDSEGILLGGENRIYNQDKYLLALQLMCGVSHALSEHWSISLGYRCMKMEKIKYNTVAEAEVWPSLKTPLLHSLEVGLRYSF